MVQGATYTKSSTFFCLFSPIADEVILCLYDDGDCGTEKQTFPMTKGQGKDKDMFYFRAYGDLDGTYYAYKIIKDQKAVLSHDPYAKAWGLAKMFLMLLVFVRQESLDLYLQDIS